MRIGRKEGGRGRRRRRDGRRCNPRSVYVEETKTCEGV